MGIQDDIFDVEAVINSPHTYPAGKDAWDSVREHIRDIEIELERLQKIEAVALGFRRLLAGDFDHHTYHKTWQKMMEEASAGEDRGNSG